MTLTPELLMIVGGIMAVIGFVLKMTGDSMTRKKDSRGQYISLIAWFLLVCGIMIAFTGFRVKYLAPQA